MRTLALVVFLLSVLALGAASAARAMGDSVLDREAPSWFGVREEVLAKLPEPRDGRYSFATLGDIQQGLRAFGDALEAVSANRELSFAVALGDLVNNDSDPHYRLLFDTADRAGSRVPVLTVPGNHDDRVLYELHLGPLLWKAKVGPDLLVGVDDSEGPLSEAEAREVGRVLEGTEARHRFVFLHRPVAEHGEIRDRYRMLAAILKKAGVSVVFAGHRHYYEECSAGGMRHVTNGMGGDISGLAPADAFFTAVSVDETGVETEMVSLGSRSELASVTKDSLVAHLYAPLRGRAFWSVGIAVLLAVAAGAGAVFLGRPALLVAGAAAAPALASVPTGSQATTGVFIMFAGVLAAVLPGGLGVVGLATAIAGLLVLAPVPWLFLGMALPVILVSAVRRGVLTPARGIDRAGVLGAAAALVFVSLWLGPRAPVPWEIATVTGVLAGLTLLFQRSSTKQATIAEAPSRP